MSLSKYFLSILVAIATACLPAVSQQSSVQPSAVVPRLMNFSGRATDTQSRAMNGVVGITFAIYKDQREGTPLWIETQNVTADNTGHYSVQLGSSKSEGLPLDLFSSGEARWLGVRVNGGDEQPRVLLLSVPYALKAADSETLGGLPASAFMLATPGNTGSAGATASTNIVTDNALPLTGALTGSGTTNYLPLWTGAGSLGNSALFQTGTGTGTRIGINTSTPSSTLDVQGAATFRGAINMAATGTATASAGKVSQAGNFTASAFNSATQTAVNQTFHWRAEPVGNNTNNLGGSLNLLFAQGAATPVETGLAIASNGRISFAAGQTFAGAGTVTSVGLSAPAADFSVSAPVTQTGTLALHWKVAPTDAATPNAITKRDSFGGFSSTYLDTGSISAFPPSGFTNAINASESSGSDQGVGVFAVSKGGAGVIGQGVRYGVRGEGTAYGVFGLAEAGGTGVEGDADNGGGIGVAGTAGGGGSIGALGVGYEIGDFGVVGDASGASSSVAIRGNGYNGATAMEGITDGNGTGLYVQSMAGPAINAYTSAGGTGVLASVASGYAAWFNGNVNIDGNLSKSSGSFKIDHPLDPANKYLYHSFVESPDMMNIYNGNVSTDGRGDAVVDLPDWFETLNRDFRYQLTVIGQFAQAIVASEIADGRFAIKTDKPNVKVSWQVTGIRQDAWAKAHRIPVEEVKPEAERGSYLHPELYGAPEEKSVLWAKFPQATKQWKEARTRTARNIEHAPPKPLRNSPAQSLPVLPTQKPSR